MVRLSKSVPGKEALEVGQSELVGQRLPGDPAQVRHLVAGHVLSAEATAYGLVVQEAFRAAVQSGSQPRPVVLPCGGEETGSF